MLGPEAEAHMTPFFILEDDKLCVHTVDFVERIDERSGLTFY